MVILKILSGIFWRFVLKQTPRKRREPLIADKAGHLKNPRGHVSTAEILSNILIQPVSLSIIYLTDKKKEAFQFSSFEDSELRNVNSSSSISFIVFINANQWLRRSAQASEKPSLSTQFNRYFYQVFVLSYFCIEILLGLFWIDELKGVV